VAAYLAEPVEPEVLRKAISAALASSGEQGASELITRHSLRENARDLRILLAEDNPVNREHVTTLLSKWGHRVTCAVNGREAVAKIDAEAFDLVLMDLQMPEMDGLEATTAIRRKEQHAGRHVPIVILTADAMPATRRECEQAGADDYLSKPIDTARLGKTIKKLAGRGAAIVPRPAEPPHRPAPTGAPDRREMLSRLGGSEDLLRRVVTVFLDTYPGAVSRIREAIAAGNGDALARLAHNFKGSVSLVGWASTVQHLVDLERAAREGHFDAAEAALEQLVAELDQLGPVLQAMIEEQATCTS
jgi:CheY-like chemotaxis protein